MLSIVGEERRREERERERLEVGVSHLQRRRNAFAETLPVFGIVAVRPLKQAGIETEIVCIRNKSAKSTANKNPRACPPGV
jgi:hypothetical protein